VTSERFRKLVEEALEEIPPRFRAAMRNVAVVVEEEPSPELLDEM
jgi:predicted Zn-dependent protease with MMP-like domain